MNRATVFLLVFLLLVGVPVILMVSFAAHTGNTNRRRRTRTHVLLPEQKHRHSPYPATRGGDSGPGILRRRVHLGTIHGVEERLTVIEPHMGRRWLVEHPRCQGRRRLLIRTRNEWQIWVGSHLAVDDPNPTPAQPAPPPAPSADRDGGGRGEDDVEMWTIPAGEWSANALVLIEYVPRCDERPLFVHEGEADPPPAVDVPTHPPTTTTTTTTTTSATSPDDHPNTTQHTTPPAPAPYVTPTGGGKLLRAVEYVAGKLFPWDSPDNRNTTAMLSAPIRTYPTLRQAIEAATPHVDYIVKGSPFHPIFYVVSGQNPMQFAVRELHEKNNTTTPTDHRSVAPTVWSVLTKNPGSSTAVWIGPREGCRLLDQADALPQ